MICIGGICFESSLFKLFLLWAESIDWTPLITDWPGSDLTGAEITGSVIMNHIVLTVCPQWCCQITNNQTELLLLEWSENVPCRAWFMFSSVTRRSRVSHAPAQMWVRTQTVILISSLIPALNGMSCNSVHLKGVERWRLFVSAPTEREDKYIPGMAPSWQIGGYFQV